MTRKRTASNDATPEVEEKRSRVEETIEEPNSESPGEPSVSVPGSPLASRILNAFKNGTLSASIMKSVRRNKKTEFEPWTGTQLSDNERVTVRFFIDESPVTFSGEFGATTYIYGNTAVGGEYKSSHVPWPEKHKPENFNTCRFIFNCKNSEIHDIPKTKSPMLQDEVLNVGTQWGEAFEALREVIKAAFEKTPFWKGFSEAIEKSAKMKVQQKHRSSKKLDKMSPELQQELFEGDVAGEIDDALNIFFPFPSFGLKDVIKMTTYAAKYNDALEKQDGFFNSLKAKTPEENNGVSGAEDVKQKSSETVSDWSQRCWKKELYIPKYHYTVQIRDEQGHRAENKPMQTTLYDSSSCASLETLTKQSVFSPSVTLSFRLAKEKGVVQVKTQWDIDDISHRIIWKADATSFNKKRWNAAQLTDVSYNDLIPE